MEYLGACGITTGVHYMPVHMHPPYRKYRKKLPVTEEIWHEILTIPLYYELKDAEQDYIVEKIHEFYTK
jgi:perosamine synthetase